MLASLFWLHQGYRNFKTNTFSFPFSTPLQKAHQMLLCGWKQGRWEATLEAPYPVFHPCTKIGFIQETEFSNTGNTACNLCLSSSAWSRYDPSRSLKIIDPKGLPWGTMVLTLRDNKEQPRKSQPDARLYRQTLAYSSAQYFPPIVQQFQG